MRKVLSISIAAYNVQKYLRKAVESITSCDENVLEDIEVIIVNDGSKDETLNIANEYKTLFQYSIKVIDKSNGGYGSTINAGVAVAEGEYFKQLDGDDWYITENVSAFIRYLKECKTDLVITPYCKYFEGIQKEEQIDNHTYISEESNKLCEMSFQNNIQMHELTIRTELLRKNQIKITENTFYTDNEYTFLPLLYADSISRFDKPIYVYRLGRDGQSVSLEGAQKHYKDTKIVAKKMIESFDLEKYSKLRTIMEMKYRYIIDSVFVYYLCSGDKDSKKKLMEFDKWLKQSNKVLFDLANNINKVKLLRISSFYLFDVFSKKYIREWK